MRKVFTRLSAKKYVLKNAERAFFKRFQTLSGSSDFVLKKHLKFLFKPSDKPATNSKKGIFSYQ